MLNYIKMDLYRMVRSKYTWVIMILLVGLCWFSSWMLQIYSETMVEDSAKPGFVVKINEEENDNVVEETNEDVTDGQVNIMIGPEVDTAGVTDGEVMNMDTSILADWASGLLSFVYVIFVVIFVNAEQKNGYIKNIGRAKNSWKLCVSKIVMIAIWLLVGMVVWCLGRVAFGAIMYEQELVAESLSKFFPRMGVLYLINLALGCLVLMLTILSRSTALSVAIGVLIPTGFVALFYMPIDLWIQKIEGLSEFSISDYMLDTSMNRVIMGASTETIRNAAIVGLVWLVVTIALSIVIKNKRDVC